MKRILGLVMLLGLVSALLVMAQEAKLGSPVQKFQQLESLLPAPSQQRLATGAPGAAYWQNRADYDIRVELDDDKRTLTADSTVTYHNASPDMLDLFAPVGTKNLPIIFWNHGEWMAGN